MNKAGRERNEMKARSRREKSDKEEKDRDGLKRSIQRGRQQSEKTVSLSLLLLQSEAYAS